jgi:hypothetical protein
LLWSSVFGFPGEANGVAVDAAGNVYVTGFMDTGDPVEGHDLFVAAIDPSGQTARYLVTINNPGDDRGNAIAVAPDGRAAVTGVFSDSAGTPRAGAVGLDASGNVNYAEYFLGGQASAGNGVGINAGGQAYLAGSLTNPDGSSDTLLAKLNPDGSVVYANTLSFQPLGSNWANGYRVTPDGYGYIAGVLRDADGPHPDVLRINADEPSFLWGYYYGVSGSGNGIDADSTGAYLVGTFQGDTSSNMILVKDSIFDGSNIYAAAYNRNDLNVGANAVVVTAGGSTHVGGFVTNFPGAPTSKFVGQFPPFIPPVAVPEDEIQPVPPAFDPSQGNAIAYSAADDSYLAAGFLTSPASGQRFPGVGKGVAT